jgi:hypothetical protein
MGSNISFACIPQSISIRQRSGERSTSSLRVLTPQEDVGELGIDQGAAFDSRIMLMASHDLTQKTIQHYVFPCHAKLYNHINYRSQHTIYNIHILYHATN